MKLLLLVYLKLCIGYTLPNMVMYKRNKLKIPYIVSMKDYPLNNETYNSTLKKIKSIKLNKKENLWVIESILKSSNLTEEDNFPSFNKFLENRNKKEQARTRHIFHKADIKARNIERNLNIPFAKDLKLLTYHETKEYTKKWVNDMINNGPSHNYPKFIYNDIYDMRDFCNKNISQEYFFIGYIPKRPNKGPYYIGAFELIRKKREFHTHLIMQNPNYINYDKDININKFLDFKKELLKMSNQANVFFKYEKLNNSSTTKRYYLSWLFEDN